MNTKSISGFSDKLLRLTFYSLWLLLLVFQAAYTELIGDEAYYWMYSQHLAWGYFDHPPIIALMIKFGYALFGNELGVRLLTLVCSLATIFVWEKIIRPNDLKTYYMLVASVAILHAFGFLAIPDAPLLFFASLFILFYRKLLENQSLKISMALGLAGGLMLLSKYHGILIIVLVLLSNWQLLKSKYFWWAAIVAALVCLPHLIWQIQMDFPTLKYHFFERSGPAYQISFTLDYLSAQAFVLGPLVGVLIFIAAIRFKPNDQFGRTMRVVFWGIYGFFFLMTFKGRTEAHWTAIAVIPGLFLTYNYIVERNTLKWWLRVVCIVSLIFIFFAKYFIAFDHTNSSGKIAALAEPFHGKKETAKAIESISKGGPVGFINGYRDAALYEFYTKKPAFSINNIVGRKNQYDIWASEEEHRGSSVLVIPNYSSKHFDFILVRNQKIYFRHIRNFQTFSSLEFIPLSYSEQVQIGDSLNMKIRLVNPKNIVVDFSEERSEKSFLYYQFTKAGKVHLEGEGKYLHNELLGNEIEISIPVPESVGSYQLYLNIKTGWLPPTINGKKIGIRVSR